MVRIVLLDSRKLFRVSLKSLIGSFANCKVVLDISSIKEVPSDFDFKKIHLVIIDPASIKTGGFQKAQNFFNYSRMIILTDLIDREHVMDYMQLGISGFFSKDDCPSQLEKAIQDISNNYDFEEVRLGSVIRQALISNVKYMKRKKVSFSDREIQVLKLVCLEKTNAEISDILELSVRTIESHRRRMIEKADCRSIIGVILNAIELNCVNLNATNNKRYRAS
ncbi:MAG: DNA-binding NarL/FixJ family response regulator [Crocinitomix sp.]|jgi:DNA-binding NarL/FixJ family response regulator